MPIVDFLVMWFINWLIFMPLPVMIALLIITVIIINVNKWRKARVLSVLPRSRANETSKKYVHHVNLDGYRSSYVAIDDTRQVNAR